MSCTSLQVPRQGDCVPPELPESSALSVLGAESDVSMARYCAVSSMLDDYDGADSDESDDWWLRRPRVSRQRVMAVNKLFPAFPWTMVLPVAGPPSGWSSQWQISGRALELTIRLRAVE